MIYTFSLVYRKIKMAEMDVIEANIVCETCTFSDSLTKIKVYHHDLNFKEKDPQTGNCS